MFRSLALLSSLVSGLACLALTAPAHAQNVLPSFDCDKASTTLEHAICADASLSRADADLGILYTEALARSNDPEALRVEQRDWAAQRAAACGVVPGADDDMVQISDSSHSCLIDLYTARMKSLGKVTPEAGNAPDPGQILTGLWRFAELVESQVDPTEGLAQEGRLIRLDRNSLSTLSGVNCSGPTLQPMVEARGRPLDADEQALIKRADMFAPDTANGVAGFCLGRLVALYLPDQDGTLLVADASAIYRLQRLTAKP